MDKKISLCLFDSSLEIDEKSIPCDENERKYRVKYVYDCDEENNPIYVPDLYIVTENKELIKKIDDALNGKETEIELKGGLKENDIKEFDKDGVCYNMFSFLDSIIEVFPNDMQITNHIKSDNYFNAKVSFNSVYDADTVEFGAIREKLIEIYNKIFGSTYDTYNKDSEWNECYRCGEYIIHIKRGYVCMLKEDESKTIKTNSILISTKDNKNNKIKITRTIIKDTYYTQNDETISDVYTIYYRI